MSKRKKIFMLISAILTLIIVPVSIIMVAGQNKASVDIDSSEAKFETTLKEAPTDGSTPLDHDIYDNIAYALWLVENTDAFKATTTGVSHASVATQKILNERVVMGKSAMINTITSGMIKQANQKYWSEDKVLIRDGSVKDVNNVKWSTDTPEALSHKGYLKRYGWRPFQASAYIISKDTILQTPEITTNQDGSFTISMELNPDGEYAPFYYKREVLANSGSSIIPRFQEIKLDLNINSSWQIQYIDVLEVYEVKTMGIQATSRTENHEVFEYTGVEFDGQSLSYFDSYKDLKPKDDNEEEAPKKDDALTMLTTALQNEKALDLNITMADAIINGLVSIDLHDLQNIVFKGLLNDNIYIEYSDSLYLGLGGLKAKASMETLNALLEKLLGGSEANGEAPAIDASAILDDFNAAEITEDGNKINIKALLNIDKIQIELNISLEKTTDSYKLIAGSAKINGLADPIELSLKPTDKLIPDINKEEYMDLKSLDFLAEEIGSIIKNKKLSAQMELSYNEFIINATINATLDKDIALDLDLVLEYKGDKLGFNLKLIDNTLFIEKGNLRLMLSLNDLERILSKMNIELPSVSLDINNMLGVILKLDFDELLKEFNIGSDSLDIKLGLNQLVGDLGDLILKVKKDNGLSAEVILGRLKANINNITANANSINVDKTQYQNLGYLDFLFDDVLSIVSAKGVEVSLSGSYNGIIVEGIANVVFKDKLDIKADLNIIIDNNPFSVTIYLLNEYNGLSNVLLISFGEFNGYIELNKLVDLSSMAMPELTLDSLIHILFSIDLNKLIEGITLDKGSADININLEQFNLDLKGLVDLTKAINVRITDNENGFNVSLKDLFNLSLDIKAFDGDVVVDNNSYVNLGDLCDNLKFLLGLINKESIHLDLSGNVDLMKLAGRKDSLLATIDTNLDLILVNGKYNIDGTLFLTVLNTVHEIRVSVVDSVIYLVYGGVRIKLGLNEINPLINEIKNIFNITGGSTTTPNVNDIFSILNQIKLADSNTIEIGLGDLINTITTLSITMIGISGDDNSLNGLDINITSGDVLNLEAKAIKTVAREIVLTPGEYLGKNEILSVVEAIKNSIDIINNRSYSANLALDIINNDERKLTINASLGVKVNSDNSFDVEAKLDLFDLASSTHHLINLIFISKNGNVYVTYSLPDSKQVKLYANVGDIRVLINKLSELTGIDMSFMDKLNNISLDTIKEIISSLTGSNGPLRVDSLIKDITVNDSINIVLNQNALNKAVPTNEDILISLSVNSKAKVVANNIYLKYDDLNKTKLNINNLVLAQEDVVINEPTDLNTYLRMEDVNVLLDSINSIMTNKKANLDLVISYQDFIISGNVKLDFNTAMNLDASLAISYRGDVLAINLKLVDDVLYIEALGQRLMVSITDLNRIMDKLGVKAPELNLNDLNNTLKAIEAFLGIKINLTTIVNALSTLLLKVENDKGVSLDVLFEGIKIKAGVLNDLAFNITVDPSQYENLANIEFIIDDLLSIMNNKGIEASFSGKYQNVVVSGTANIDFKNKLSLKANLNVMVDTASIDLVVYLMSEYKGMSDVLLISFGEFNGYVELNTLLDKLGVKLPELGNTALSLDTILNILFTGKLNEVLTGLELNKDNINANVNLDKINADLGTLLNITKRISLVINNTDKGFDLSIAELFDLRLSLSGVACDIVPSDNEFINLNNLIDSAMYLASLINKESLSLNIAGSANLGRIMGMTRDVNAKLEIDLGLILMDSKYNIEANVILNIFNTIHEISLILVADNIYISYGNIRVMMTTLEAEDLMTELEALLGLNINIDLSQNTTNKLFDLIKTIKLNTASSLELDLTSLINTIGRLSVSVVAITDNLSVNGLAIKLNSKDVLDLAVDLRKSDKHEIIIPDGKALSKDDILGIVRMALDSLEILKNNNFNGEVSLKVYQGGAIYVGFNLTINLRIYDNNKLDLMIEGVIDEYNKNGSIKNNHIIEINYVAKNEINGYTEDMVFIEYGNNKAMPDNKLRMYLTAPNLFGVVGTLSKLLGIDMSFLNKLLPSNQQEIKGKPITDVLLDILMRNNKEIKVSDILSSLDYLDNSINIKFNQSIINPNIPSGDLANLAISLDRLNQSISLSATNIYSEYRSEKRNTRVDIQNAIIRPGDYIINAPGDLAGWYDINDINTLADAALNTLGFKDFRIQGTVTLQAISIINVNIPVDLAIRHDDNHGISIYAHLNMGGVPKLNIAGVTLNPKQVYIYYQDGYVYLNRREGKNGDGDSYQMKLTLDTFMADIAYYLLDYCMNIGPAIMDLINAPAANPDYMPDASKTVTQFKSNGTSFTVGLDMGVITGNSDLEQMLFTINTREVVKSELDGTITTNRILSGISSFSFGMVGVIKLLANDLSISNIEAGADGFNRFTEVLFNDLSTTEFVSGYVAKVNEAGQKVDASYKNGKFDGLAEHTITFDYNHDYFLDKAMSSRFKGQTNSLITFPNIENVIMYEGKSYELTGWYLDDTLETKFEGNVVPGENITLYAKWELQYNITINNEYGETKELTMLKGKPISELNSLFNFITIDGAMYKFMGYSLEANGEALPEGFTMPGNALVLYALWQKIEYKLYVDDTFITILDINNNMPIEGLSGKYMMRIGDFYIEYDSSILTPSFFLHYLSDLAVDNGASFDIHIQAYERLGGYYEITFDYAFDKFVKFPYIGAQILEGNSFTLELPNGLYAHMGINYWYDEAGNDYLDKDISEIKTDTILYAYYATSEYLTYSFVDDHMEVNGFTYSGSEAIDLVFPKYVKYNGEYVILAGISEFKSGADVTSAFYKGGSTSLNNIKGLYFNDGMVKLGGNAFKNNASLTRVYFSDTMTSISKDAFYFDTGNFGVDGGRASAMRFYTSANSTINTSGWVGTCNHAWAQSFYKEYGKSYGWSVRESGGKIDLTKAFNKYEGTIRDIVHSLF